MKNRDLSLEVAKAIADHLAITPAIVRAYNSTMVGNVTPEDIAIRDGHGANFIVHVDLADGATLRRRVIVTEL